MVLLLWLIFCYLCCLSCYLVCSVQPCGHRLERAGHLTLLYVMFYCALALSHVVSLDMCGTLLYRFLNFASLHTLMTQLWTYIFMYCLLYKWIKICISRTLILMIFVFPANSAKLKCPPNISVAEQPAASWGKHSLTVTWHQEDNKCKATMLARKVDQFYVH